VKEMSDAETAGNQQSELGPSSAPESYTVSARNFETEDKARSIGQCVGQTVNALGRYFNLSRLDGV
jgi:hypothetical protein